MSKKTKTYITLIAITLAVGGLSAFLTRNSTENLKAIEKPPLMPPSFIFPIVWTVLFILMAVSMARVLLSDANDSVKSRSLILFAVQLFFNFTWSLIFFNMSAYLFALIWLLVLLIFIIMMTVSFYKADKLSSYLQIPYIAWVLFAFYLNLFIFILNRPI